MEELITRIFKESHPYEDNCQMNLFFSLKREELENYDPKEVIIALLNSTIYGNFISSLLTYSRWMWKDFHLEDWKYILARVERKKITYRELRPTCYRDLTFLSNLVGINAIDLFLSIESIPNEDKKMVIETSKAFWSDLIHVGSFEENALYKKEEDEPYDDEIESIIESDFILHRQRLMSEGAKFGFSTNEDFYTYMYSLGEPSQ